MNLEEKLRNSSDYHGVDWLEREAENGDVDAQFELGYYYGFLSDRYAKYNYENDGFKWISKAAENGHRKAMFYLGYMYQYGFGDVEKDDEKYRYWTSRAERYGADGFIEDETKLIMFNEYKKGAEQGDLDAIIRLAICYGSEDPHYVPLLEKAASAGIGEACQLLGWYYSEEDEPHYDKRKAIAYFVKGEEKGHLGCEYQMIERYWLGDGVEKDIKKAVKCCFDVIKSNDDFCVETAYFYLTEISAIEPQENDSLVNSNSAAMYLRNLMEHDDFYAKGYTNASWDDAERAIAYYKKWHQYYGYESEARRITTMKGIADQIVNCPWPNEVDSIIRDLYFN